MLSSFGRSFVVPSSLVAGLCFLGTSLVMSLGASTVGAQTGDAAVAEALFQSGKRLMDAGDFEGGCPKLVESHRLDPAGGTILAAAMCFDKAGKTAAAWAAFTEALAVANRDKRVDRARFATERLGELAPLVPQLTLTVSPFVRGLAGLVVQVDDKAQSAATWDTPLPVEPGSHKVRVLADGRAPAEVVVTLGKGEKKRLDVPTPVALASAPAPLASGASLSSAGAAPAPTAPVDEPPPSELHPTRTAGLVVLVPSVIALGVGLGFGVSAQSKTASANDACPGATCSDRAVLDKNDTAGRHATIATVLVPVGLVGAGVGAYLALRNGSAAASPRSATRDTRITPGVAASSSSLTFSFVGGF
jgi:hypothetical protein